MCTGFDKYFDISGVDILIDGIAKTDIREVKILIPLNNADDNMRSNFRGSKEEMENKDIMCEMRVIVDPKIYREDHDRWILSSNINYNLMSPSIAKRGQYSERKETKNRPSFDDWWKNSLDIFSNWDDNKNSNYSKILSNFDPLIYLL